MLPKEHEVLLFIDTPYRPDVGCFCKPSDIVGGRYMAGQWYTCREIWHYEMTDSSLFFYSHALSKTRAVVAFMAKVEEILDVAPRTRIGPTQRKTICWVEPSPWWVKLAMRRSLFTILLRVAQQYRENDFEAALFSHRYTKNTRYAIERFLAGYTKYTGRKRGWVNQFHVMGPTPEEIDKLLIRREDVKRPSRRG